MHQSYFKKTSNHLCRIHWILELSSLCCATKLFTWASERSRKLLSLSPAICFYYALENYNISRQLIQLCLPIAKDNLFQRDRMSQYCTKTVDWKASFECCFFLQWKIFYYKLFISIDSVASSTALFLFFFFFFVGLNSYCAAEFLLMQYWAFQGIFCSC